MAHAIAQSQPTGSRILTATGYETPYEIIFVGPDVAGGQITTWPNIRFDFGDNEETLRAKVRQAVLSAAQESGTDVQSIHADVLRVL